MSEKPVVVAILFGGRSAEHEVSLLSAKNVVNALDREKFVPVLIGIDKTGSWFLSDETNYLLNAEDPEKVALVQSERAGLLTRENESFVFREFQSGDRTAVDVVFPVLHGTYGEDGTVQGLLQLLGVPFVGPELLGSSIAMDKDVSKRLLRDAGVPVCPWQTVHQFELASLDIEALYTKLGPVLFVKPANLGSSVGIRCVKSVEDLGPAIQFAFTFDTKIVVEQAFPGREIECAVLGNEDPKASIFGEIVPSEKHGFYSYDAKYVDPDGAALIVPAEVDATVSKQLQATAIRSFQALCCEGMARVDFLLKADGSYVVNELNTIPGFTKISMYPRLWQETGISYTDLITKLIEFGMSRSEAKARLSTEHKAGD